MVNNTATCNGMESSNKILSEEARHKRIPFTEISKISTANLWSQKPRHYGEGNGNPLQYSWLGNSMDRVPWRAMGLQRVGHNQGPEHTLLEADMRTHCPVLRQTLWFAKGENNATPHLLHFGKYKKFTLKKKKSGQ